MSTRIRVAVTPGVTEAGLVVLQKDLSAGALGGIRTPGPQIRSLQSPRGYGRIHTPERDVQRPPEPFTALPVNNPIMGKISDG